MGIPQTQNLKHLIWIDPNVDNEENKNYVANMENIGFNLINACLALNNNEIVTAARIIVLRFVQFSGCAANFVTVKPKPNVENTAM